MKKTQPPSLRAPKGRGNLKSEIASSASPPRNDKLIALAFLFFLCLSSFGWSKDEPSISVKAELDRAFITIGDPVQYSVIIQHDPSIQILSSIPPPASDILKIKKIEELHRKEGETMVEGRKFTLTAFRLGEFILDPIEIQYRVVNKDPQKLSTNQLYLTVKSVSGSQPKTDIRGIKAVIAIPGKILGILLFIFGIVGVITIFMIYRALRKSPVAITAAEPALGPEEEALLHLNQLFDSDMLRRGKIKEYYFRLSEILRIYLERRFQVLAIESTTDEIRRALRQKEITGPLREKITEVLEAADLAKFAKWKPEPPEVVQLNQKSKQIIEEAKPREASSDGV